MANTTGDAILNLSYDSTAAAIKVVGGIAAVGLATEAKQDDEIALLTTIDADTSVLAGVDFATQTTLATLATETTVATLATEATVATLATEATVATLATEATAATLATEATVATLATEATLASVDGKITACDTTALATEATAATLATEATLASIDGKITACDTTSLATEVTVATLATETTLASIDGKVTACDTGAVVVSSGAITETNSGDIMTAVEKIDDLQGALKSIDTDELITRITDSAGTEINPAKEDGNLATLAGVDFAVETGGNLATVKTNTDPLVTVGGGGYIRQDSTATIAIETGGNLAATATVLGTTTDAAIDSDTTGTLSGKLRGLVKIFADVWDSVNSLLKVQEQSPVWSRGTDPVALIAVAQDFTANMVDLGGEITCGGYKYLRVWLTLDINDSTDCRVAVLGKHTTAGAVEAPYDPNKWTVRDSTLSATGTYREWNTDADGEYIIEIELDNAMPFVQIQIQAGTVGGTAGQIDASSYVLGY
jgi:hypothetical protein